MKMSAVVFFAVIAMNTLILCPAAAETGMEKDAAVSHVQELPSPDWKSRDDAREDFTEDLSLGFSFWWILVFFVASAALMVWLVWQQNRGGRWFVKGGENIEVVARRMFGTRHGVVCVRLRDREFLLGIGGDNVSLISEWRVRERSASDGKAGEQPPAGQGSDGAGGFPV